MSDNERFWNLPTIILAVLAAFGIATIPQAQKGREGDSARNAKAEAGAGTAGIGHTGSTAGDADRPDLGALQPLEEYGRYNYSQHEHFNQDHLLCHLVEEFPDTRFLIVTVPDPDDTSVSHEFDSVVDAVVKAAGNLGFAADRHAFPWSPDGDGKKPESKSESTVEGEVGRLRLTLTMSQKKEEKSSEPASILCRRWRNQTKADEELLLLLLVPETPTWGIDAKRFDAAINLVRQQPRRSLSHEPIRIVGPNYTGSIPSLARVLKPYLKDEPFVIYNGSADEAPDSKELGSVFDTNQVEFLSTVHRQTRLIEAIREFLNNRTFLSPSSRRVALLVETGTIFGGLSRGNEDPNSIDPRVDYFAFPFGISQLRQEYSARGFYQPNQPLRLSAPERLSLQAMAGRMGDSDVTPIFSPGTASLEGELGLNQILQELQRGHYDTIGIISTDAYDRLFLAFKVRQFCPDVRLAFTSSTSLFTHPDIVPYLRGSLVVSSYPIHPESQAHSFALSLQSERIPITSFQNVTVHRPVLDWRRSV